MNLAGRIRAPRRHQAAAVFGLDRDKFGFVADLAQQIVVAEIGHEILAVRGDAERDVRHRFQEKRGMRGAVREVNMKMVDLLALEEFREIAGVSRPRRRLHPAAIFLVVRLDQRLRPALFRARLFFPEPQDRRRRRVMNRRLQPPGMRVPNAGQRRMNRTDRESEPQPFEREHLRVAKSLREDGITRIEVAEAHFRISDIGNRIPERSTDVDYLFLSEIRYPKSEIKRTGRLSPDPSRNRGRANRPCSA